MPIPEIIAKLPVTMKTTKSGSYIYSTPPNTYIPPGPPHIYAPNQIAQPAKPSVIYLPAATTRATTLANFYLPPNTYIPPLKPSVYLPPVTNRPTISQEIVPPALPTCTSSTSCCEEASAGKFVIPIPLKSGSSKSCCLQFAKLILPINGFDDDSIRKLTSSVSEEIDAKQLIRKILANLL